MKHRASEAVVAARARLERAIWKDAVDFVMCPTEKQWRKIEALITHTHERGKFLDEHLGICHECNRIYLKRKHGAGRSRFCSRACGQKAYRERKKMWELMQAAADGTVVLLKDRIIVYNQDGTIRLSKHTVEEVKEGVIDAES